MEKHKPSGHYYQTDKCGSKRQYIGERVQRHGTRRQKKARRNTNEDVQSLADAIRTCVPNLIRDVMFGELEDAFIESGCLTEDECKQIGIVLDRKKQVRKVVLLITKRSYTTMSNFIDALNTVYPFIAMDIWYEYDTNRTGNRKRSNSKRTCPICRLKSAVDVEIVMDQLYSAKIIDRRLYSKIDSSTKEIGQQAKLWNAVLKACLRKQGIDMLLDSLEMNDHFTHITSPLRKLFANNTSECMRQLCTCSMSLLDRRFIDIRTLSFGSSSSHAPPDSSSDSGGDIDTDIGSDLEPETEDTNNPEVYAGVADELAEETRGAAKPQADISANDSSKMELSSLDNSGMDTVAVDISDVNTRVVDNSTSVNGGASNLETDTEYAENSMVVSMEASSNENNAEEMQTEVVGVDSMYDPLINNCDFTNHTPNTNTTEVTKKTYTVEPRNLLFCTIGSGRFQNASEELSPRDRHVLTQGYEQPFLKPTDKEIRSQVKRPGRFKTIVSAIVKLRIMRFRRRDTACGNSGILPIDVSEMTCESEL